METAKFTTKVSKIKNIRELNILRNHYILKRKQGDHTYKTLTRIKLLTNLLLAIEK